MAVLHEVLLYGSETWVTSLQIGRTMGGFHHRLYRRLTGWQLCMGLYGMWFYPPLVETMVEAGIQEVDTYVYRFHNT